MEKKRYYFKPEEKLKYINSQVKIFQHLCYQVRGEYMGKKNQI